MGTALCTAVGKMDCLPHQRHHRGSSGVLADMQAGARYNGLPFTSSHSPMKVNSFDPCAFGAIVGGRPGENPDLRRAASVLAHDSLFLSLQCDPNSRSFAEDRIVEILRDSISPLPLGAAMTDLISTALREENKSLKEQIAERDEVVRTLLCFCPLQQCLLLSRRSCQRAKSIFHAGDTISRQTLKLALLALGCAHESCAPRASPENCI